MAGYEIRLQKNGVSGVLQLTEYRFCDGSSVSNAPITDIDKEVVEQCRGLVRALNETDLKIKIERGK